MKRKPEQQKKAANQKSLQIPFFQNIYMMAQISQGIFNYFIFAYKPFGSAITYK